MADVLEVEKMVMELRDFEAIKRLKYKYFRCLDQKQWDELAQCFTEDAITSYSDGKYQLKGKHQIMEFLKKGLGSDSVVAIHHGHHPEIEMVNDTTAKGTWGLYGYRIDRQERTAYFHGAFYHDEYVKVSGEWKIKSTGYTNTFEEIEQR